MRSLYHRAFHAARAAFSRALEEDPTDIPTAFRFAHLELDNLGIPYPNEHRAKIMRAACVDYCRQSAVTRITDVYGENPPEDEQFGPREYD